MSHNRIPKQVVRRGRKQSHRNGLEQDQPSSSSSRLPSADADGLSYHKIFSLGNFIPECNDVSPTRHEYKCTAVPQAYDECVYSVQLQECLPSDLETANEPFDSKNAGGSSQCTSDVLLYDHDELGESSSLDNSLDSTSETKLDHLTACVYSNDLIMKTIVENVVKMQDRVSVELTCRRLLRLSRSAAWKFTSEGDHFSMTYKTLNAHVSVELGDVWFVIPSMTLETRRELREQGQISTQQPEKLMTTLTGMATRFALGIRRITIGGSDMEYREWGVRNHQFIVTADLLRFLNDRLLGVRTLVFRECGFDREAVEYLASSECRLGDRIQELSLIAVWLDADAPATDFVKLLGSNLSSLHVSQLMIDGLGAEIVMRLRKLHQVDRIRVTLEQYHRLSPEQACWYVRSLSDCCKWLEMRLRPDLDPAKAIVDAASAAVQLYNLTVLEMEHIPKTRYEHRSMAYVLENLCKMSSLRVLRLAGWKNTSLTRCMAYGIHACYSIETLSLRNIPPETSSRALDELFLALPTTIDNLELEAIPTFGTRHLEILSNRLSHIRTLRLSRLSKAPVKSIMKTLTCLSELNSLHCEIALPPQFSTELCDSRLLPHLRRAVFRCSTPQPESMLKLLGDFFVDVSCHPHPSNLAHSWIRVSTRRQSAPAYPRKEVITKTESRARRSRRPARTEKLEWETI